MTDERTSYPVWCSGLGMSMLKEKRVERFFRGGLISKSCTRVLMDNSGMMTVVKLLRVPICQLQQSSFSIP